MPIAVQSQLTTTNRDVTFTFQEDVVAYVVGVAWWSFTFGADEDHHVRRLSLSLQNNKNGTRQVTTRPIATLSDDSGNRIDDQLSQVRLCCVAVTRAQDSAVGLASATGIPSGGTSPPISLPGTSLAVSSAFLSGFSLVHGDDHHVQSLKTSAGFLQQGNVGFVASTAEMVDTSGHDADGTIDGGLVTALASETGLVVRGVYNLQTTGTQPVDMGVELREAAVLLQSLVATFGSKDHHVRSIGGGCRDWHVDGDTVSLESPRAFVDDASGHDENDEQSGVSLVLVGIPL